MKKVARRTAASGDNGDMAQPPAADASSVRSRPVRPRRRLGRGAVVVLTASLALWLSGRGFGWFGRGRDDSGAAPAGEVSAAAPNAPAAAGGPTGDEAARSASPEPPTAGTQVAGAETSGALPEAIAGAADSPPRGAAASGSAGASGAAASGEHLSEHPGPAASPDGEGPPATGSRAALDGDRFHSLCSIVELQVSRGELAAARASLANLRLLPLDEDQSPVADRLQQQLATAVHELGVAWCGSVQRGEVLAARQLAARWFEAGGGVDTLPPPLAQAFVPPLDWRQPLRIGDTPPPQPVPLARQRRVRLDWRAELVLGNVATAGVAQVTVRVETSRGQSYPTVPAVACEPLDADANEAVEMALVAVAAGESLLARLWWARALVLGVDVAAPRPAQLLQLLR